MTAFITTNNPFALQDHLDSLFASLASSRPSSQEPSNEQQINVKQAEILHLLGLANRSPVPLNAKLVKVDQQPTYWEEHLVLDAGEKAPIPVVVLVPKGPPPFKSILVFHGHEPGAEYVLGHYPDPETAAANLAIDNNYAQALAEAGYLVCVVEQRGLGQRLTDQVEDRGYPSSCRHLAFSYLMQGRTLVGERCWDGQCALDYLQTRSDVTPGVMGCTGHSGGGCTALWLSLIDERITAVIVSGYFNAFTDSILAMRHCECNYVPGLLKLGEMGDLAALLAPRPLCIIHGQQDNIYPVAAAKAQFETVAKAYTTTGNANACCLHIHPGGHAYHIPTSLSWFQDWL
jgi:dienelactone hydrolase